MILNMDLQTLRQQSEWVVSDMVRRKVTLHQVYFFLISVSNEFRLRHYDSLQTYLCPWEKCRVFAHDSFDKSGPLIKFIHTDKELLSSEKIGWRTPDSVCISASYMESGIICLTMGELLWLSQAWNSPGWIIGSKVEQSRWWVVIVVDSSLWSLFEFTVCAAVLHCFVL